GLTPIAFIFSNIFYYILLFFLKESIWYYSIYIAVKNIIIETSIDNAPSTEIKNITFKEVQEKSRSQDCASDSWTSEEDATGPCIREDIIILQTYHGQYTLFMEPLSFKRKLA
ncbi:hypothetical protein ACJX0J_013458, partial [Zea mays]